MKQGPSRRGWAPRGARSPRSLLMLGEPAPQGPNASSANAASADASPRIFFSNLLAATAFHTHREAGRLHAVTLALYGYALGASDLTLELVDDEVDRGIHVLATLGSM